MAEENDHPDDKNSSCGVYLSLLEGGVDVFVLLKLLQLCLDQNLSDVHHLLHRQSQTLHGITELLLEGKKKHRINKLTFICADWKWKTQNSPTARSDGICCQ